MKKVEAPSQPITRVIDFINAFQRAPNDADIEIMLGMDEDQRPALLVSIAGDGYPLLVSEARRVADIMERAMNDNPADPEAHTLPNIIMGLRAACIKADRGLPR